MTLTGSANRLFHRLIAIGHNRFQLFLVEAQEERNRLVDMVFLGIVTAALGLLSALAFSAAIVVLFWHYSPVGVLAILGSIYMLAALILCRQLLALRHNPPTLQATLDQLQKDRECLKKN